MINGLLELLTTKRWAMQPEALDAYRHIIQANLNGHVALEAFEKKAPYNVAVSTATVPSASSEGVTAGMPGSHVEHTDNEPEVQAFVAILPVCGPITRNGDACTYGSADLRDAVMEASDQEECKGIIFYINTPGGSVAAVPDFKYAIDYAHEHNKKVVAFVDGLCASCGMYLAALCDERYYMNKEDQIGCIGVLAAFYTEKDGSTNQYTNETYHELYATQSPDKNKWHRDAAEGDYAEIQAELDADCEKFHEAVKVACPNVKPEHLAGGIFNAEDVDGILMDGQRTLDEIIDSLVNDEPNKPNEPNKANKANETNKANSNSNSINMNNYPLINAALGMEAGTLVVNEEGTHMDATLLDKMEATLAEQAQKVADAEAKATELAETQKALADAQASLKETEEQIATAQANAEESAKALADANTAHEQAMADAKAEADKALADAQEAGAKALSAVQEELNGAKEALATAEQTIADRDAQIKALTEQPAQQQAQGEAPANNGTEVKEQTMKTDFPQWDGKESMTAYKARRDAWHKAHNC